MSDNDLIRHAVVEGMRIGLFVPIAEVPASLDAAVTATVAALPEPVAVARVELRRYWNPKGGGVEPHDAGLLYLRDDVDAAISNLYAALTEAQAERDAALAEVARLRDEMAKIAALPTARPEAEVRAEGWAAAVEAAYHAGIDAAANRYLVCASPDAWDYFSAAHDAMKDLKSFAVPSNLTPPADIAPLLAARDARIREQALREAADGIKGLVTAAGDAGLQDRREGLRDALDAILALIGGDA